MRPTSRSYRGPRKQPIYLALWAQRVASLMSNWRPTFTDASFSSSPWTSALRRSRYRLTSNPSSVDGLDAAGLSIANADVMNDSVEPPAPVGLPHSPRRALPQATTRGDVPLHPNLHRGGLPHLGRSRGPKATAKSLSDERATDSRGRRRFLTLDREMSAPVEHAGHGGEALTRLRSRPEACSIFFATSAHHSAKRCRQQKP